MDDLLLAHSSDLHIGFPGQPDPLAPLRRVLDAARQARAHALVLVGDVFDNNRVPDVVACGAARLLMQARLTTVILPGNHDPLTDDSVYRRGGLAGLQQVTIIGLQTSDEHALLLDRYELAIWGRAHRTYDDMHPLRGAPPRAQKRHVVLAHGHWVAPDAEREPRSWPIRPAEIDATGADYVALGHWDRAARVEGCAVPAYYSGSPDLAGSINVVRFDARHGGVEVRRHQLGPA